MNNQRIERIAIKLASLEDGAINLALEIYDFLDKYAVKMNKGSKFPYASPDATSFDVFAKALSEGVVPVVAPDSQYTQGGYEPVMSDAGLHEHQQLLKKCEEFVKKGKEDAKNYIPFGDVAHNFLHEQTQYASRYLDGRHGSPNFGKDIRFKWLSPHDHDYHSIVIHKDDVEKFVQRVIKYRKDSGQI